jgi:hypothetical protein
MLEFIVTLFVSLLVIIAAIIIIGPIAYIVVYRGTDICKFVKGTIKWNINRTKDPYDIFKD